MASTFMVAAVVTIVPSMAALWHFLRRYEGYFQDARVFFSLVVGFFAGLLVTFLENVLFPFASPEMVDATGPAFSLAYFTFGYALLESAAKLVVLGSRAYRVRKDTPYYGAALGLGFGAMASLALCAGSIENTQVLRRGLSGATLEGFILIVLMASGLALTGGASGVWAGKGSSDGRLWRGLLHATLWQAPVLFALWFWLQTPTQAALEPALFAAAYGAFVLVFTQVRVLDRIVPPEIRDLVQKDRRREKRRQGREGTAPAQDEPLVSSPLDPPPRP